MASNISKIDAQIQAAGRTGFRYAFHTAAFCGLEHYSLPFERRENDHKVDLCLHCRSQWRTLEDQKHFPFFLYADHISNQDAEKLLHGYVASTKADHDFLRSHLPLHGDVLITRWKNKGKTWQKRVVLLQEALPGIHPYRNPIPQLFYDANNWYTNPEDRITWLLPWLNTEALLENSDNVLHLIHERTVHEPHDWVMFENKHLDPGWRNGSLRTQYNENAVVMHGPQFGKLAKPNQADTHRWNTIGYPRARLILEAQSVLYGFLRRLVSLLIEGANLRDGCEKWEGRVGRNVATQAQDADATDMFTMSPAFAPESLLAVVDARRKAAEDELWILQTEPVLLQQRVRQHLSAQALKTAPDDERWNEVTLDLVHDTVQGVDFLQCLVGLCESAAKMHKQHEADERSGKAACLEYARVLFALETATSIFADVLAERLDSRMCKLSAFEQYCTYTWTAEGRLNIYRKPDKSHGSGKKGGEEGIDYFKEDPVFWSILRLPRCFVKSRENRWFPFDATVLLDYFHDQMAACNIQQKKRIDSHTYALLSDISAVNQILIALRMRGPHLRLQDISKDLEEEYCMSQGPFRVFRSIHNSWNPDIEACSRSLRTLCELSWPSGPKNEQWLEEATRVRCSSQAVWDSYVDVRISMIIKLGLSREELGRAMALFRAAQAPEHLQELQAGRLAIEWRAESRRKQITDVSNASIHLHDLTISEQADEVGQQPKAKIKTRRGDDRGVERPVEDLAVAETEKSKKLQIGVKANNLSLFSHMFPPQDDVPDKSGTRWEHFASALADAGFAMSQSRGSAVAFSRPEGSIIFHRPHPDPVIEPLMLRAMGKRLRKWFGWGREVFVQRA